MAEDLARLAERFWQFQRHEFPLTAFMAGQPNDDPTMFREGPDDHERRALAAVAMLAELDHIPIDALALADRITYRLLQRELTDLRDAHATLSHLKPWLLPGGPEFTAAFFANMSHAGDATTAEHYADRLASLPAYFADVQACLAAGIAKGVRYPRVVLGPVLDNLRTALSGPAERSPWYGPFARSQAATRPGVARQAERARRLIADAIVPALSQLRDFVADDLIDVARDTVSCLDDPQGDAFYSFWTRHFTTDASASPVRIHALGLSEVARIGHEMAAVAASAGHADDLQGYRHFLAQDPQFICTSAEDLRERLQIVAKRIDALIPTFFGRLPRTTYGVQSIPAAASERMPPAYAQPNPTDGSSAGTFWISGRPDKAPSYLHVPLALHEGWPGHLMHIALMQEMTHLPAFRRASFNKYSACLEGWALYCETLGIDMGLYETPHQHFGRLDMEMWRACRLVVDTGLHVRGWTRTQAIDYLLDHLSLSRATIEGEVDRYIAMPAQALGYQIGNLRFRELRARAESRLGERFDLRRYHDQLLAAGPVTLPLLDEVVEDWLRGQG
jgi:uncharacterized protein (DUF885 family)